MPTPQVTILVNFLVAVLFSIGWVYLGLAYWPEPILSSYSVMERLDYALVGEIFVAVMLLLGIVTVANQRFFSDANIDGSQPAKDSSLDINIRYLQNTHEQVLLAFIGHLCLALVVPASSLNIIPVLVALFVLSRIFFWIGYHISPSARSFGFATTFLPTVGVYLYLISTVVSADA